MGVVGSDGGPVAACLWVQLAAAAVAPKLGCFHGNSSTKHFIIVCGKPYINKIFKFLVFDMFLFKFLMNNRTLTLVAVLCIIY